MLQANPSLTFRYLCEEKACLRLIFCTFHLRMRGPWCATKRLFASFATAIFRKFCRGPHGQKHKYGMGAPLRASEHKKYIES